MLVMENESLKSNFCKNFFAIFLRFLTSHYKINITFTNKGLILINK